MKNNILVSSTDSLEGYNIIKYYGICSERIVVGAGVFSEFFAGFTDIFGGRSGKFEDRLNELYDIAMNKLMKSAISKGANVLLGVKLDIDEISGKSTQMFMINAIGTAVFANKIDSDNNLYIEENNAIMGYDMRKEAIKQRLIKKLEESTHRDEVNDALVDLLKEDILLPIDYVLELTTKGIYSYTKLNETEFPDYLSLYDKVELNTGLNEFILKCKLNNNVFFEIYNLFAIPDYTIFLGLVEKLDVNMLLKSVIPVLLKYKDIYTSNDIESVGEIYEKLKIIKETDRVEFVKASFGKEVWVCSCGKRIPLNNPLCSCTRGKNGFTSEQAALIDMAIEHIGEIKKILEVQFSS